MLDLLDVTDHITIDAMGCQRQHCQKDSGFGTRADYVLALKRNQGTLSEDMRLFWETEAEAGHGRIETRKCKERTSTARQIAQTVRAHWAIENVLHWTLDVVFNEDKSTVRKDHVPENMAIVRHVVLNMLNTGKNISRASASRDCAKKQVGKMTICA